MNMDNYILVDPLTAKPIEYEVLPLVPDGDVLIHAGDFTNYGDVGEVIKFNAEIGKLPHKYKVVIAGNHELGFEDGEEMNEKQLAGLNMLGITKAYELLSNCIYLCDRETKLFGLRIYGAPWHSMPGHGDFNAWNKMDGILAGDVELLNTVEQRVKPKYHVFGHVHQQHGATTNGSTTFINASICDHKLRTCYDPIIFDMPLPPGTMKQDFLDQSLNGSP
ncbi:unnamed protein product, partial [Mesorhabditis belari]|uniref:Calcineurin-like phosphoesterase domain-containing protein n=1 Tax=Mesorhabditis belari TaxID=2138241 RepID=A0AAF3JC15_9BILA